MTGEFKIEKGFSGQAKASYFNVTNPQIDKKEGHIVYTCTGICNKIKFEIFRRYSDFLCIRDTLSERFPGLYVPPIPAKKAVGNK